MARISALVVGGGPAAFSLFLAARRQGRLQELLDAGILVIERTSAIGRGTIGDFAIRSDSHADSFVASAAVEAVPDMKPVFESAIGRSMIDALGQPVPLSLAADFLAALAVEFMAWTWSQGRAIFATSMTATCARQAVDGSWTTTCRDSSGIEHHFQSDRLVLATGAQETTDALERQVGGVPLLSRHPDKLVLSSEMLGHVACERFERLMEDAVRPRVAIVGGSHSAVSCARHLLMSRHASRFDAGAITVLHRRPFRLTYATPDDARADGYRDFGDQDICPRTGRVHPLAGFRCDARELMRRSLGLAEEAPDGRLRLLKLGDMPDVEVEQILNDACVIISAVGYRPRALRLIDRDGDDIPLRCDTAPREPLVDGRSRVLDRAGKPIPGVHGIGLAAGFPLAGRFGEPSFTGQANGLSLWQSTIGEELVAQLLEPACFHKEATHG